MKRKLVEAIMKESAVDNAVSEFLLGWSKTDKYTNKLAIEAKHRLAAVGQHLMDNIKRRPEVYNSGENYTDKFVLTKEVPSLPGITEYKIEMLITLTWRDNVLLGDIIFTSSIVYTLGQKDYQRSSYSNKSGRWKRLQRR